MPRKKKPAKAAEQRPQPEQPKAVKVHTRGKIIVEGNRTIRIYPGDVFLHHMAIVLWRDARDYVEPYDASADTDVPYSEADRSLAEL